MTNSLNDVQHAPELPEVKPGLIRSWLMWGAMGVVLGGGLVYVGRLASGPQDEAFSSAVVLDEGGEPNSLFEEAPTALPDSSEVVSDTAELESASTPEPDPGAEGAFYVRVASYKEETDAAQYASSLVARGLPAQASADPSGAAWHLVRLGPFSSRGEAEKARFELKAQERKQAYVLPRSNGKYHVQVGSFATLDEAEPVAERFSALGHTTKVSRIKMGDRRWHCVRIGPFDTAEEAEDYQALVKGLADTESVVIPYGPPRG